MNLHKRYLVLKNYGPFENWGLIGEMDDWNEAILKREEALSNGAGEVIITEYCPIVYIDGRNQDNNINKAKNPYV